VNRETYLAILKKKFIGIGVKRNSTLIVCADVLKFLILIKKDKVSIKLDDFIDLLIELVGKKGTLIFYSFNWNFFNGKIFDFKNSKSFSGAISNCALKRKEFKRSKNPVYSLLVYGKYQSKICNMKHEDCFNESSPFGFLLNKNTKCLFFDLDYKNAAFPFFHVAEQKIKLYYRFFKKFSGKIHNGKIIKKIYIKMFVRKNNYKITTIYSEKTDDVLRKNKALNIDNFFDIKISLLNIKKLYTLTLSQLSIEEKMLIRKKTC
jgi:aminoglycoside 3-N-acetyltransferase